MKIVITDGYRWSYFQWFLLGLQKISKTEGISFELDIPLIKKLTFSNNHYVAGIGRKLMRKMYPDSYNLDGYIVLDNGEKRTFTIDSADAPFLFDEEKLKKVDVYFKMQCPKDLKVFHLTPEITIPWCDHAHVDASLSLTQRGARKEIKNLQQYASKIKPLMIGPRSLSKENGYKSLVKGYENYIKEQTTDKPKKLMCYFGNALGPKPEENISSVDWDWEADIMGFYKGAVSHPNEKRARAAELVSEEDNCDARVISLGYADRKEKGETKAASKISHEVVPLEDFCRYISSFHYNLNISGYRLSIPNRFIESFMVGTAIITDKLAVKWYQPFESEVIETVEMGYLKNEDVDWDTFRELLKDLQDSKPEEVIKEYNGKWVPEKVSEYIIRTLVEVNQ